MITRDQVKLALNLPLDATVATYWMGRAGIHAGCAIATQVAVAAQFSYVQIRNPEDSGVLGMISTTSVVPSAAGMCSMFRRNVPLPVPVLSQPVFNLSTSGNKGRRLRSVVTNQASAANLADEDQQVQAFHSTVQPLAGGYETLYLLPGEGFVFRVDTVNIDLRIRARYFEMTGFDNTSFDSQGIEMLVERYLNALCASAGAVGQAK